MSWRARMSSLVALAAVLLTGCSAAALGDLAGMAGVGGSGDLRTTCKMTS